MVKDIIKASLQLSKKDKMLLVNEVLASMSSKQGRTMPVYRALETFGKAYKLFKGTDYTISKADFRWMKELLNRLHEKIVSGIDDAISVTDDDIIDNLNVFLTAVKQMQNTWYFDNRFTPEGLAKDFDKIYGNIHKRNSYENKISFRLSVKMICISSLRTMNHELCQLPCVRQALTRWRSRCAVMWFR